MKIISLIWALGTVFLVFIAACATADNILRYQRENNGWPRNAYAIPILSAAEQKALVAEHLTDTSFDNRNSYPLINYLARAHQQIGDVRYCGGKRIFSQMHRERRTEYACYGTNPQTLLSSRYSAERERISF